MADLYNGVSNAVLVISNGATFRNDTGGSVTGPVRAAGIAVMVEAGAVFEQGEGSVYPGASVTVDGGTLRLGGGGGGFFVLQGTSKLQGDIAPTQSVVVYPGAVSTAGNFTNAGILTINGTLKLIPSGSALTNTGQLLAGGADPHPPSDTIDLGGGELFNEGSLILLSSIPMALNGSLAEGSQSDTQAAFINGVPTAPLVATGRVQVGGTLTIFRVGNPVSAGTHSKFIFGTLRVGVYSPIVAASPGPGLMWQVSYSKHAVEIKANST